MKNYIVLFLILMSNYGCSQTTVISTGGGGTKIDTSGKNTPIVTAFTITNPFSRTVVAGDNATFSVATSGGDGSSVTFSWYSNNVLVSGATSSNYVISGAQMASNGAQIYAVAHNASGQSATSATATLTVTAGLSVTNPASQTVNIGDNATFSVTASGGHLPYAFYQWYANDAVIPSANQALYLFGNAQLSDNGKSFKVVVQDANGIQATSQYAYLTVNSSAPTGLNFSYTTTSVLNSTSAAVYDQNNNLVRNLWGNKFSVAGVHDTSWDGKDDLGNWLANGNYYVKVQKNGIYQNQHNTYRYGGWLGTVFNNSDSTTGGTKYHGGQYIGIENIGGGYLVGFHPYLEGNYCADLTTTAHPHQKSSLGGLVGGDNVRTDNDGHVAYALATSDYVNYFIYGVTTTGQWATFSNSVATSAWGQPALALISGGMDFGSDIAVQKDGNNNFIFLSLPNQGLINVYDRTGTLVKSNSISFSGLIECDRGNGLWIGLNKYTVSSNGTITSTGISVSGVGNNLGASVSADNNTITFMDGAVGSQQLKSFSNSTGAATWTYGQAGGYYHDVNVAIDKFCMTVQYAEPQSQARQFISYNSDGTFWMSDAHTFRNLLFDANRNYLDKIAFLPGTYVTYMDVNSPTHIYASFLRCTVDLNSDDPQHNWVLDKCYSSMIPSTVETFEGFHFVSTFPNGRTYAATRDVGNTGGSANHILELGDSVRYTPSSYEWQSQMGNDGTIAQRMIFGGQTRNITGYNGADPIWTDGTSYVAVPPSTNDSIPYNNPYFARLSDGAFIGFGTSPSNGYHLGKYPRNGSAWQWLASPSTGQFYSGEYGLDGYFNNGNGTNNPAGNASVWNDIIYWNHHGEFWRLSGQTSYHHLVDKYGLPIWVDGTLQDVSHPVIECAAWNSGNALHSQIAYYNGKYILCYADESRHGGVHLVKLQIDSSLLQYETHGLVKTSNTSPSLNYIDLMSQIPIGGFNPPLGYVTGDTNSAGYNVWGGRLTYGYNRDIYNGFFDNVDRHTIYNIPTNTSSTWKITGLQAWISGAPNLSNSDLWWIDLKDVNGKIISRFVLTQDGTDNYETAYLEMNGRKLWASPNGSNIANALNYFELKNNGGSLSCASRDGYVSGIPIYDNTADITKPAMIDVHFQNYYYGQGKTIDAANLRFYPTNQ